MVYDISEGAFFIASVFITSLQSYYKVYREEKKHPKAGALIENLLKGVYACMELERKKRKVNKF